MRTTFAIAGLVALTAVSGSAQAVVHNYENLAEGFLGTTYAADGITYRDVNNVSGAYPDNEPFGPSDLGNQLIIEDATLFFNDFPGYGSADKVLTFGSAFVNGDNVSIGALASVYIDIAGGATSAAFDIAYYENGPWGNIEYHLDAIHNGSVVASDTFLLSDLGGRDNVAWQNMSVNGTTFETLHLYATLNGGYTAPRGMIDNLTITPVPEPATLAALGLGAVAMLRRRKKSA
jgi:hypothetical protein